MAEAAAVDVAAGVKVAGLLLPRLGGGPSEEGAEPALASSKAEERGRVGELAISCRGEHGGGRDVDAAGDEAEGVSGYARDRRDGVEEHRAGNGGRGEAETSGAPVEETHQDLIRGGLGHGGRKWRWRWRTKP